VRVTATFWLTNGQSAEVTYETNEYIDDTDVIAVEEQDLMNKIANGRFITVDEFGSRGTSGAPMPTILNLGQVVGFTVEEADD
jgi:hypothetical protein